jgi:NTP pyrophosphatase (non-canonical NTP hydrolase)
MLKTLPFAAIREIADACAETAKRHGWHEEVTDANIIAHILRQHVGKFRDELGVESVLHRFLQNNIRTMGVPVMSKLALICSEVGEAIEAFRDPKMHPAKSYYELKEDDSPDTFLCEYPDGGDMREEDHVKMLAAKPLGLGSELADIVIRVFDLAGMLNIDIAAEIERKMRYNESRPYKHGGKVV